MRVLIADDDRNFAEILAEFVRACGHEVVDAVTAGGLAAIQSFARHEPDVVLLDIVMPRCNGLTVCHAIQSRNPNAKIVFVSGLRQGAHPFLNGCQVAGYLQKPIELAALREVLDGIASAADARMEPA